MVKRTAILSRAWAIFRANYNYPAVPFRSIGRACFNACLKHAWAEARQRARIAAIPAEVKAERIANLQAEADMLAYRNSWFLAQQRSRQIDAEIAALAA